MKTQTAKKSEIFLLLALRQAAEEERQADSDARGSLEIEETNRGKIENDGIFERTLAAFSAQLDKPILEKIERLRSSYQDKPETEKRQWRERVAASIETDASRLIDAAVHPSHIEAALNKEIPAIREIVAAALPVGYKNYLASNQPEPESETAQNIFILPERLKQLICRTFAVQFVALRDLENVRAFDGLSGAQLARLARFAGIREVAFACAGISAVEAVAGFLRRFEPEDARAIAAQLSGLPKASDERLAFAQNLVQSALENEPKPSSATLDWLGIRLIGIFLCAAGSAARIAYAEQKLPLETEPKLSQIIETECRKTPDALLKKIADEVELLAETIAGSMTKTK